MLLPVLYGLGELGELDGVSWSGRVEQVHRQLVALYLLRQVVQGDVVVSAEEIEHLLRRQGSVRKVAFWGAVSGGFEGHLLFRDGSGAGMVGTVGGQVGGPVMHVQVA